MAKPLIELHQFNLSYGQQPVLNNLSLTLCEGEKVALIGPSGCGKTSLLKSIVSRYPRQTAFCPQDNQLIDLLSVYNNIYLGRLADFGLMQNLLNLLRPNPVQWRVISQLARQLEIEPLLKKSPSQLSGGQQRRVAIARGIYQQKAIFVGDEPLTGLDKELAEKTLNLIQQRHSTLLISLHDRELAMRYFSRVILIQNGHMLLDKATSKLSNSELDDVFQQSVARA